MEKNCHLSCRRIILSVYFIRNTYLLFIKNTDHELSFVVAHSNAHFQYDSNHAQRLSQEILILVIMHSVFLRVTRSIVSMMMKIKKETQMLDG